MPQGTKEMQLFIGSQRDGSPVQVRGVGNHSVTALGPPPHADTSVQLYLPWSSAVMQTVPQPLNPDVRIAAGGGEVCFSLLPLLAIGMRTALTQAARCHSARPSPTRVRGTADGCGAPILGLCSSRSRRGSSSAPDQGSGVRCEQSCSLISLTFHADYVRQSSQIALRNPAMWLVSALACKLVLTSVVAMVRWHRARGGREEWRLQARAVRADLQPIEPPERTHAASQCLTRQRGSNIAERRHRILLMQHCIDVLTIEWLAPSLAVWTVSSRAHASRFFDRAIKQSPEGHYLSCFQPHWKR